MNINFDGHQLDIPCPSCGEKFHETIGRLKNDPKLTCPACGQNVSINAKELRDGIAATEKSLDDLRRSLGKIGK